MGDVTELIAQARGGDKAAADRLFALVYDDMHRLAQGQLRRDRTDAMQTTSLVHETFLRFADPKTLAYEDREHFYAVLARAMRQVLLDRLRHRDADKRGGDIERVALATDLPVADAGRGVDAELLALDHALTALAALDARLARLVELRFFAGLSLEEAGALMGLSERTLKRDWRRARAWLYDAIEGSPVFRPT